ncbi:hypothetical protein CspeluHIS016_0206640 [Cutaneotrichosporon spelunceum]|uniref:Uncharacterized protein n=1 Tax=Cutaneotrichosporon spelunceum TaxID=1672016 RepID=A0AAD3TS20_9TREE|nr:hypothetical protein CspeluHIS016_0206640 [Cutaneotrichosporon spelunceum]
MSLKPSPRVLSLAALVVPFTAESFTATPAPWPSASNSTGLTPRSHLEGRRRAVFEIGCSDTCPLCRRVHSDLEAGSRGS